MRRARAGSPSPGGELPQWERGTAAVLCAAGLHAVPISTAVRADRGGCLFALGAKRETLARLRNQPAGWRALPLRAGVAFTAYGRARVVCEQLQVARGVVALELTVERGPGPIWPTDAPRCSTALGGGGSTSKQQPPSPRSTPSWPS